MKHHGKQRKTAQSVAAKAARQSLHLSGPKVQIGLIIIIFIHLKKFLIKCCSFVFPKAFPLDRLLAIFYSIVEEDVVPSVHVLSQVASLVTLQFLIHVRYFVTRWHFLTRLKRK